MIMELKEKLQNFRQHQLAMDVATEEKRAYTYLYQAGGHCPINWSAKG